MAGGKLFGQARIKANGREFDTKPKATLDVGGNNAETVPGDHKVLGFMESTLPSKIECEAAFGEGDSIENYRLRNAVITFECDTGQTYVIPRAWTTVTPVIADGAVKLTIEGVPAEEML